MGGKSSPAPTPEAPKPAPIPDVNAKADTAPTSAAPSFAQTEQGQAEQDKEKQGLGAAPINPANRQRRPQRDAASVANQQSSALGSSAVLTG